jgi:hypothetical protein
LLAGSNTSGDLIRSQAKRLLELIVLTGSHKITCVNPYTTSPTIINGLELFINISALDPNVHLRAEVD